MMDSTQQVTHSDQRPHRKVQFIAPFNFLKSKVGYGGIPEEVLRKAQAQIEHNPMDFQPMAEKYLATLMQGIEYARSCSTNDNNDAVIAGMLYPAMELKACGSMFRYPLVTRIGDRLICFLATIRQPDEDVIDIVLAFHKIIRAVLVGNVTGSGGKHGSRLINEFDAACQHFAHCNNLLSTKG